jgi:hypothetical protein
MRMIFGAIGGMKIGRGNRSARRKPTIAPLCPPQNPTWQTRSRSSDRSGEKPATNRLSYGAAFFSPILVASYDSQGHSGGIRTRLHTGNGIRLLLGLDFKLIITGRLLASTVVVAFDFCVPLSARQCKQEICWETLSSAPERCNKKWSQSVDWSIGSDYPAL